MFGILPAGVRITEHFDNFDDETLVEPKPVKNWPKEFGKLASNAINKHIKYDGSKGKILVVNGGAGRTTLQILQNCSNLELVHSDCSADHVFVLDSLLKQSQIEWDQPVEGNICKKMQFSLDKSAENILGKKGNTVAYIQAELADIPSDGAEYSAVVADIRHKNAAEDIKQITSLISGDGLLILGSIDDVDEENTGKIHSSSMLTKYFDRIAVVDNNACFPHIYCETRNKHQYAMSYFSVWRRKSPVEEDDTVLKTEGINAKTTEDYYEDQSILASYDVFHFGEGLLSVKNFPLRMSEVCIEACRKYKTNLDKALDAGCGPGRTAMELCQTFKEERLQTYLN